MEHFFDGLVGKLSTLDPVPTIDVAEQRFGKLRISLVRPDERASQMIAEAIDAASAACDRCGKPGTLRRTPDAEWARRCGAHADMPAQLPTSERLQMIKQASSPTFDGHLDPGSDVDP